MNRPNTANNMKLSRTRSASRSSRIRWSTSLTTMRNLHKAKRPIQWDWINLPICDQKNVSAAVHWRNRAQTKTICSSQTNDQRNRNLSDLFFMFFVDIIYLCCCDMNRHCHCFYAIVVVENNNNNKKQEFFHTRWFFYYSLYEFQFAFWAWEIIISIVYNYMTALN